MGERSGDTKTGLLDLDDPTSGLVMGHSEPSELPPAPTPTLVPAFDLEKYAEESEFRERMPTLTDDSLLEEARLQSMRSYAPPARPLEVATVRPAPVTARPGPRAASRDSAVELDLGESDLESLDVDEQVAILKARLAPLTRVPVVAKAIMELGPLVEEPKAAYVLGFIDGILPLDTIIDVTGLPELETLRVVDRMVAQAVIVFKPQR